MIKRLLFAASLFAATGALAQTDTTAVSTPSGSAFPPGSLVGGNLPVAAGHDRITDSGKVPPAGAIVGTSDSQTLTNKSISGAANTLSNIPNAALQNQAMTFGGQSVSLGSAAAVQGNGAKLQLSTGTPASGEVTQFDANGNTNDSGIAAANVTTLSGAQAITGLKSFSGGLALPSPTNPSGSNFYLDSNGALHIVNSNGDFQGIGAKFSGDATRPWFTSSIGSGITESSSSQQPNIQLQRNDYFAGGSGLDFNINAFTNEGKGVTTGLTADVAANDTTFPVTSNSNIAVGQVVYGPGIPAGATVSSYNNSTGSVTISGTGFASIEYSGTKINFINASNSTPQNSHTTLQGTANCYTTQTTSLQTCLGVGGYAFRYAPSSHLIEGANLVANDNTGRKSSVAGSGAVAFEADVVASGPDDAKNRMVSDLIASEAAPSADGATSFQYGLRLRPAAALRNSSTGASEIVDGFSTITMQSNVIAADAGSFGQIDYGHYCDSAANACLGAVSGSLAFSTDASAGSGQPVITFPYGTNINPNEYVSGSPSIAVGAKVSSVLQCPSTSAPAGCLNPNHTQVTLSANLAGIIASNTSLTFTGAFADGTYFNGIFGDAFANWINTNGSGVIKAGTTNNTGTVLRLTGFGEDSTNTAGIDYGDINFKINTNTHGSTLGELNLAPGGSGCITIGTPTGGCKGANTTNIHGALYIDGVAAGTGTGTVTTTGSPASGNLAAFSGGTSITNGDLSGDCTTAGTLAITCAKTNGHAIHGVLAADGSAHATGNDTTEDTLATIPVPANSMGANSCLQINTLWDYTGSTNSKSLRVRFSGASGTAYLSVATSTASNVSANYITRICNRNATNSQIGGAAGGAIGVATAGLTTSSVDTSAPTTIVITGQKGSAGETLQLDAYEVSL